MSRCERSARMAGTGVPWEGEAGAVWNRGKGAAKSCLEIGTLFGKH